MPARRTTRPPEPWERRLLLPSYSVSEAARYAHVHANTIAYWHYGRDHITPTLPGKERGKSLSYLQLVEVAFVAAFRRYGVTLSKLKTAHAYFAQTFNSEFPFAEYRLKTEGVHVLLNFADAEKDNEYRRLVLADGHGQMAWQSMISDRFMEFEYDERRGIAIRWLLGGQDSHVVIDPRIAFGAPTIRGVPTWAVANRARAGEDENDIRDDFGLTLDQVRDALDFEGVKVQVA